MTRSKPMTVAAILQLLLSLFEIVGSLIVLPLGAGGLDQTGASPPYIVVVVAFAIAVLGLVSAYGVWRAQKWGVILTIVLRAVGGFLAVPGLGSPSTVLRLAATTTVVTSIAIVVLLLWPKPKLAPASNRG
jgi:hypothetical protein